jgi:hypothetical protein
MTRASAMSFLVVLLMRDSMVDAARSGSSPVRSIIGR